MSRKRQYLISWATLIVVLAAATWFASWKSHAPTGQDINYGVQKFIEKHLESSHPFVFSQPGWAQVAANRWRWWGVVRVSDQSLQWDSEVVDQKGKRDVFTLRIGDTIIVSNGVKVLTSAYLVPPTPK